MSDTAIVSVVVLIVFSGFAGLALWSAWRSVKAFGEARTVPKQSGRKAATPRPGVSSARKTGRGPELLPADATVDFAAERRAADVDDVFTALDKDLIGLLPVKIKVQEIASLLMVDRTRQRFGLAAPRPNLHMCFTGPPGTGKTTVGLLMADLLHQLGYLERGQLVHAMRDDMVGEFVGQTAPKTRRVLEKAMGGVLFI